MTSKLSYNSLIYVRVCVCVFIAFEQLRDNFAGFKMYFFCRTLITNLFVSKHLLYLSLMEESWAENSKPAQIYILLRKQIKFNKYILTECWIM